MSTLADPVVVIGASIVMHLPLDLDLRTPRCQPALAGIGNIVPLAYATAEGFSRCPRCWGQSDGPW